MGAIANAATLLRDPTWRNWVTAASAYVATEVYSEATNTADHAVRYRLALDILTKPDLVTDRMVTLTSTTTVIAQAGAVPSDAHEPLLLTRVREVWTVVAKTTYPVDPV